MYSGEGDGIVNYVFQLIVIKVIDTETLCVYVCLVIPNTYGKLVFGNWSSHTLCIIFFLHSATRGC